VVFEKSLKALIRHWIDFISAAQNNIRSSANIKCTMPCFLHLGWYLNDGVTQAFLRALGRYSILRTNSSADNGSPYLNPLPP